MADLTPHEIGEYTGCEHGEDGKPLFGCINCAIVWHLRERQNAHDEWAHHSRMVTRLEAQRRKRSATDDAPRTSGQGET